MQLVVPQGTIENRNKKMKNIKFLVLIVCTLLIVQTTISQDWKNYDTTNSPLINDQVRSVCIDKDGTKWFGTDKGLNSFDGVNWITFTCDDILSENKIYDIIFEESDFGNTLWLATEEGVTVFDVTLDSVTCLETYQTDNSGLISNKVVAAVIDTGKVKWFATDSGISTFNGESWRSYSINDYLMSNKIQCIASAKDGWNYLGTYDKGVNRISLDEFDVVTTASPYDTQWSGLASDSVLSAFIDSDGIKWFGTNAGVSRHEGEETKENWISYKGEDGLVDNVVQAINQDNDGKMWFGTPVGVSCFDGMSWETFDSINGLNGNSVYDIAVDADGSIWLGTNGGVSHFFGENSSVEGFETAETISDFDLKSYPNPFNNKTKFIYTLRKESQVVLKVFNILGREVRTLINEHQSPGRKSFAWDGKDKYGNELSSGVYIYHIITDSFKLSSRIILLK